MKVTYITLFLSITAYAYNRKSVNFAMPQIIEEGLDESHAAYVGELFICTHFMMFLFFAGLVITCQNAAFAVSKFIVGVLSDRCSPGLLFLSGLLLSGLVTVLFSWSSLVPVFCVLWFVNGFAQGANWPPVVKIIQQKSSPSKFGTLCSLLLSGNNLANCVSPVLSAYIVASYSWRTSVYVAGLTSMILCLFAVFVLQRSSTKSDLPNEDKTVTKTNSQDDAPSTNPDSPSYLKMVTSSNSSDDPASAKQNSPSDHKPVTPCNSPDGPASAKKDSPSDHKTVTPCNSLYDPTSAKQDSPSDHKMVKPCNSSYDPASAKKDSPSDQKMVTSSNRPYDPASAKQDSPSDQKTVTSSNSSDNPAPVKQDSPSDQKTVTSSNSPDDPASAKQACPSDHKPVTSSNSPDDATLANPDSPSDHKTVISSNSPDDPAAAKRDSPSDHEIVTLSNSLDDPASNSAVSPSTFSDLLKDPFLWLVSTGYLVVSCYHTTLLDWGQLFLMTERGRTQKEASFFISSMEIGGFFGGIVAGYLTDIFIKYRKKVSPPKVLVTAANSRLIVLGIFIFIVVVFLHLVHSTIKESSSIVWIVCLGCALGIFVYGSDAIIGVVSSECAPDHLSGSALAVSSLAGNVGAMVTGYPFCTIAKYFGWTVVFVILEVMTLLTLCAIIGCKNLQPKHLRRINPENPLQVP